MKEILNTIEKMRLSGKLISNNDILSILHAVKKITTNDGLINSLIFLKTTLNPEIRIKTSSLTPRENQILHLIGNGKQSNDIAIQLELSNSTVETHRKNIRKKLDLTGKGKLIEFAILNNIIQLNSSIELQSN
ncbi:MAG: helix-turn-helix transcriptional regulator [Flavobacteriaceae bacterium]|nr:helix-turn-helix transcriptional regulator [Flavobacteriaceae bacterium]